MIRVEKLIPGGQALATLKNGKKIFLWNALHGEEVVEYQTTKNKSSYSEGIATKIKNPSPFRIRPKDACYLSTSPWQILNYEQELIEKQNLIIEIFREHQITIDRPEILTDYKDFFYRNKMEYSLYWNHDTNQIELSFHARGSHRKVPISSSSIERPEIFNKAKEIVAELNSRGEEARKYQSLLLRCNQKGEVSGGLYENRKPHPTFPNLKDVIFGHEYSYSPNGFFQINLPVYELTLKEIKKHIATDRILDLYAGVGTIGLSIARGKNLTLVEVDKFAYSELIKNVAKETEFENGAARGLTEATAEYEGESPVTDRPLGRGRPEGSTGASDPSRESTILNSDNTRNGNVLAVLSKSEKVLDYIEPDQTVILDPPRAGCDKKLTKKLNETLPKTIIYLSCNPATQARDVKLLLDNYDIVKIKAFNYFPRTPHIENLIILEKK